MSVPSMAIDPVVGTLSGMAALSRAHASSFKVTGDGLQLSWQSAISPVPGSSSGCEQSHEGADAATHPDVGRVHLVESELEALGRAEGGPRGCR